MRGALALVTAVLSLAFTSSALAVDFTASTLTAPGDQTFPLFTADVPNTIHVQGTVSGGTPSNADINCYFGTTYQTLISNVSTTGNVISEDVPLAPLGGLSPRPYCMLRAVPTGDTHIYAPDDGTTNFGGVRIGIGRTTTFKISDPGINQGALYNFLIGQAQKAGFVDFESAGSCGLSQIAPFDPITFAQSDPLFSCNGWFLQRDGCTFTNGACNAGTHSEIRVDGVNAYLPGMAQELYTGAPKSTQVSGFPSLTVDKTIDPLTGNVQMTESDQIVKCSPDQNTFSLDATAAVWHTGCTSFAPAGMKLARVMTSDRDGRRVTITDVWSSTDGAAHELELTYEQDISGDGANFPSPSFQYSWLGPSYSVPAVGDTVAGPSSEQPVTVMADGNAGLADQPKFPQGAMTFGDTPKYFEWYYRDVGFIDGHVRFLRTVPAGGSVTLRHSYVTGLTKADVASQVPEEQARLGQPKIALTSPTSVDNAAYLATGTATDPAGGITELKVNGDVVPVGADGSWSKAITLSEGANTVTAIATDTSGNTTTVTPKVTYTAPPPAQPLPVPSATPDKTAPTITLGIVRTRLRALLSNGLPVKVRWSEPCTFSITLKVGSKTIGKASGTLGPASSKRVVVKLTKKAKKQLKRLKKFKVAVKLTARDAAGNVTSKSAKATIKR